MATLNWLDSNTIRSLLAAMLLAVASWALVCLGTNVWDWRQLVGAEIAILIPFLKRLSDPDVIAPLGALNWRAGNNIKPGGTA